MNMNFTEMGEFHSAHTTQYNQLCLFQYTTIFDMYIQKLQVYISYSYTVIHLSPFL